MNLKFLFLLCAMLFTSWAWADDVSLTQDGSEWYVNVPNSGTNNLTLNNTSVILFKVYDDGGKNRSYSNSANGSLVITVPTGYTITINGTLKSESNYDKITIYDGSTTSATKLVDGLSGEKTISTSSTGNQVMIYFKSDVSQQKAGFDFTVLVFEKNKTIAINTPNVSGGKVTATPSAAKPLSTISLDIAPQEGYLMTGMEITDNDNNKYDYTGGKWYDGENAKTVTFTSFINDITVEPTFTDNLTAEGGLKVDMIPLMTKGTKTMNAVIPAGVKSFKVNYNAIMSQSNGTNGYSSKLVITAPQGYVLKTNGTMKVGTKTKYDSPSLYINDGDGTTLYSKSGFSDITISNVESTKNTITISVGGTLNNSNVSYNTDLTISVEKPIPHNVNIKNSTNGTVESDKATAYAGEMVTINTTPAKGYLLKSITITDSNGKNISLPGPDNNKFETPYYDSNEFTFKMPGSDVEVATEFIAKSDLLVKIPYKSQKEIVVPEGITTFKVQHTNYTFRNDDYLLVTVPTGCTIQVGGFVQLNNYGEGSVLADYFQIFDGSTNSATSLGKFGVPNKENGYAKKSVSATSSGNQLLLYLHSNDYVYDSSANGGVHVTITVVDNRKSVEDLTITVPSQTYTYDGSALCPTILVKDGSTTLTSGTDYNVTYSNNVNAGNATVTITGAGLYKGSVDKTFKIDPKTLTNDNIYSIECDDYSYTGSAIEPTVNMYDIDDLILDKDYAVTYSNNVNAGTNAKVIVEGKGNYTGKVEKSFTIDPKAVLVSAINASKTYGESDPEFEANVEGLIGNDQISYTFGRRTGENVGLYTITPKGERYQGNYVVTYVDATLSIERANVTAYADDKEKTYGEADPEFTYHVDGLVGNDKILVSIYREPGNDAGEYPIYLDGDYQQGNYYVAYNFGTLTINRAIPTVPTLEPLTLTCIETIEDIELPEGFYLDEFEDIEMGETQEVILVYDLDDPNYEIVEGIKLSVTKSGHTAADAVKENVDAPTCTETGSHDDVVYCSVCGIELSRETDVVDAALGHAWGEYVLDGDQTCTEDGHKTASCTREGCTATNQIVAEGAALGHAFTNYIYNNDATKLADGTETAVCDHGCGETDTRVAVGTMLPSTVTTVNEVDAEKQHAKKYIENGMLIIEVNGVKYDVTGRVIK
ncbi:MAG: hypothetical protein E7069_10675 [Bacteroidales bacterium]|nr:hypothetical protein [Bacteroidales bacterium]